MVLCSGKVKLSTTSRDGKVLILKMATPGEALGLSAVISGTPYELTAETVGPCQVNFIDREALMRLLDKYGELGLHSAQVLAGNFNQPTATSMSWCWLVPRPASWRGCCSHGAAAASGIRNRPALEALAA